MDGKQDAGRVGLFGLTHSNRRPLSHWSKNCFNSSFPAALACYMLAHDIPAIYNELVWLDGKLQVISTTLPLQRVFQSEACTPSELAFHFESSYTPYQAYAYEPIDGIDLVLKSCQGAYLAPLEVKLTVLPTSQTSRKPENQWGCELVIRAATTSYAALGMFDAVAQEAPQVRHMLERACSGIQSWDNDFEMRHHTPQLAACIDAFQSTYLDRQKPLLLQAIWKTEGQTPTLANHAFDVVIWSDFAFSRLFVDDAGEMQDRMSRPMRATARLARCLWELSRSGKIHLKDIYRQMAFGNQTDKEFAINGDKWRRYTTSPRIHTPIVTKECLHEIIDIDCVERLMPERRFDQTLFFTMKNGS